MCKSCHLRTESLTDIPVIGKELYFNFIKEHPELCLIREQITLKLINENFKICNDIFGKETILNNCKFKVKPVFSNLKYYKKQLIHWKKERDNLLDFIIKDKPTNIDIKFEMNIIRNEINKYEDLIKNNKTE